MTTPSAAVITVVIVAALLTNIISVHALGSSATTLAVVYGGATTICGIVANQPIQKIQCYREGQLNSTSISPEVSYDFIAGGKDGFAAVRSGGFSLLYWNKNYIPKRLYNNYTNLLTSVTMGDTQICSKASRDHGTQNATCWRGDAYNTQQPNGSSQFVSVSSGSGFSCGVLETSNKVVCWGNTSIAFTIQSLFSNETMVNIFVGEKHACGMNSTGFVICKGDNNNGQLNVPSNMAYEYFGLALGANHTCGIRSMNHTVVCWGGNGGFLSNVIENVSFESVVAGLNFTCGLTTSNFSVVCWGPGWPSNVFPEGIALPLPMILPGPCVQSNCSCGIYPQSQNLCSGNGNICKPCDFSRLPPPNAPPALPPPPPVQVVAPSSPSRRLRRGLLAYAIVGSVGGFAGICAIIYFLWAAGCFGKKKVHNSVQPTITATSNGGQVSSSSPVSRSSTLRRQGSRMMRRQRSGTSSKHTDRAEEFLFSDLVAATNNFSSENKIGAGSFGIVYKGKLLDGREVAIKRGETGSRTKKFQEKESAFDSELAFLSRLHHKHLVRLVGYCEERDERLLVYEYMKNGALFDHLHDKNNVEKSSSMVNSWKVRIKIALDAARGIEYLHNYAVPPIIHRDIKSSNILIDANWIARVSDFGLSLMGPESNRDYSRPVKAAGTVGYIDPEYYGLNVLTAKSDVYGLGVVLLELLTGKRAIFKSEENGGAPISVVDFAVPAIMAGELTKILDYRVGQPEPSELEAVELVAYTAMHCVHLEGKDRPTISDIVSNLERALAAFDDSHGSISSGPISFVSD